MNYAQIFDCDIANGPGMRVSLFVSGCTHHCEGCFNAQTWDFAYGKKYTSEITQALIQMMDRPYIKGITILGGEPMEPENQKDVLALLKAIRNAFRDSKNIWIYSGYVFEQLTGKRPCRASTLTAKEILSLADVLVDGEFVMAQKDVSLAFRGSRNQRILDCKASLKGDAAVWLSEYNPVLSKS